MLVVDDEPSVTYLIARRLEEDGLECERAESAKDALEQLKRRKFDVVITDIRMPGMSGIKLLKRIKDMDSETQVIVMTGHSEVQFAVEAIRSDVDDYLLKPFELEQLSHAVGRAMEHRALQQENRAYRRQLEESGSTSRRPRSSDSFWTGWRRWRRPSRRGTTTPAATWTGSPATR